MSFIDDIFDKHQHRQRVNVANQHERSRVHEESHFPKHREWMGEWRNDRDPSTARRYQDNDSGHHFQLLRRLIHNKTLLVLIGVVLIVVLGLVIATFFYVLPMILKLFGTVDASNWQGLLNQGIALIQKILTGGKIN
jgi:hypothetical protein